MSGGAGWPNGARLAMSFVVNVEEGSEMNPADGDRSPEAVDELGVVLKKPVRNFGNESNYQYGIKAGAPRVMALLTRYGVTADRFEAKLETSFDGGASWKLGYHQLFVRAPAKQPDSGARMQHRTRPQPYVPLT